MMSQACLIKRCRRFWREGGRCRWPPRRGGPKNLSFRSGLERGGKRKCLLRKGFRLPFRRRSKVNRGQDGADQHYQQVDFHVTPPLRHCSRNGHVAKGVPALVRSSSCNDSGVIKNG